MMIPLVAPNFFRQLPHALHSLLESGILLAAIAMVGTHITDVHRDRARKALAEGGE